MLSFTAVAFLLPLSVIAQLNNRTTPALNITAISTTNGESVLECWQLNPFSSVNQGAGLTALSVFLGNATNATYQIVPPRTNHGLHNAPEPQFVYYASGLIRFAIPNSTQEAYVVGGKYGLIFAEDTPDLSEYGHVTDYVADADTVALTVPLAPGEELEHKVLHSGGCTWSDQAGL